MAISDMIGAIIVGLVIGSLARLVVPVRQAIPMWLTIMIGVLAAIVGMFIATALGFGSVRGIHFEELLVQIGLAAIAISIYVRIARPGRGSGRAPAPSPPPGEARPLKQEATGRAVSPPRQEKRPATAAVQAARRVRDRVPTQPAQPAASAAGVFISYRRQDTQHLAGRLYDRLRDHFGRERVFMDVDSIEPGLDFGEAIDKAVRSSGVMLVLIGENWLTSTDRQGRRRLDNPDDYVRLELEATLNRQVRVIPVLVEGAAMPTSQELPASLASFSRRNALEMTHTRFDDDAKRLIDIIQRVLDTTPTAG